MSYGERLRIRSVCPDSDLHDVRRLYASGLLEGQNDPGHCDDDIANLVDAYFGGEGGSHFWIAELLPPTADAADNENNDADDNDANGNTSAAAEESDDLPIPIITYRRNQHQIIGMIGAMRSDENTIEIRRLRVDPAHQKCGVGKRLIEKALDFCHDRGYLKVLLDTRVERIPAVSLFEQFGFQLTRTRTVDDKQIHEFYLNLYCKNAR